MVRLEDILEKVSSYNSSADLDLIKKAYVFSGIVHQGQTRLSGEPYLSHPLEVANILASLKMDATTVATGLLHDTVEDTHTTLEKIEETFGKEISTMVDGLTKMSRMTFERKEDQEAENLRKMILAMSKDIRVIVIKLADRLHNMRTIGALHPEKQKRMAQETLDIYAPIANRLGIGWLKTELEDLSFACLEPEAYNWIKEKVAKGEHERKEYVKKVKEIIEAKLKEHGISGEVTGRSKHLYSIYKKMKDRDVDFENIYDLIAFRVIVDSVRDCYGVLGIIHSTWKPVPGRFKDYIAIPKPNMYQSLHTTVVGPYGERMEVQIRTAEMHRIAEYGIAAHWKYKEGKPIESKDDKYFTWLRQLLEWQRDLKDSGEFMETLKVDLFPEEVFVFTPKGDIKVFPAGATPVDFAYAIHTDVGHRCAGAKVNNRMVPLRYKLKNGDVVEIITSSTHNPSKDWLNFVVTSRAKTRIRQWIKTEEREKSMVLGREICEKEFKRHGLEFTRFVKSGELERIAKDGLGLKDVDSLLASVGYGKVSVYQVLGKILPPERLETRGERSPGGRISRIRKVLDRLKVARRVPKREGVIIRGVEDVMVRFARCCNPLPGDEIAGFITHGQGVAIHTANCSNLLTIDPERQIEVEWDTRVKTFRPAKIQVICKNEKGLLAEMSSAIKTADANISSANIMSLPNNRAVCTFEVEVSSIDHLRAIIRSLKKIRKVIQVERIKG